MSKLTDDRLAWVLSYTSGQKWLSKLKSDSAKKNFVMQLKRYCDAVNKTPDELLLLKPTQLELAVMLTKGVSADSINENAAEDLLENYLYTQLKDKPNVQNSMCVAVKSFYRATRGRALADDVGEDISEVEHKKRKPKDTNELIELEEAMVTHRDRFLIWFLESCPVRKGTLRQLTWKDLKPTGDKDAPYMIKVESARLKGGGLGKYAGCKHIGFLHTYAVKKMESYKIELKERA